ncbi:MAG: hypothetical protein V5A27_07635 [Halapricum sp.]
MSFLQYVPGMVPGSTTRNVIVGLVYLLLLPVMLFVLIGGLAYHTAKNTNGLADNLSAIPGISEGGGALSGIIVFVGLLVLLLGIGSILGAGGDAPSDTQQAGTGDGGSSGADVTTPTPTAESARTPAPDPTATPIPTSTPTSTPEPTPSPTPTGTPTPTPAPTPAPDGASYDYSGTGQTATDSFVLDAGLVAIDLSHDGERNFIVELVNTETGDETLLVNTIGGFDGTTALYTPSGEYVLNIEADGDWSGTVRQPRYSQAEVVALPDEASRSDYALLGPYQFSGTTRFTIDAETESNVIAYLQTHRGENAELLVNEIGPHEGSTVFVADGVGLIYVETEGEWTVTIESEG